MIRRSEILDLARASGVSASSVKAFEYRRKLRSMAMREAIWRPLHETVVMQRRAR
jgi:hypothetical protein